MDNISKRSRRWKGRKWLVMMMSMIVMCLAPAYGACSDCEDPNPDYDPDNPYESDPECIPKQNDCTGYVDWYSFGRAKECGICFARGEERRLGSCSLPDCPGCDDRQRLLEGWWQNQCCKGIPWGEVWDRMSGTLKTSCGLTGVGCARCGTDVICWIICAGATGACLCDIQAIHCGDCILIGTPRLFYGYGCVN